MVYFIWDTFDVLVSESAIGRLLRKKKWTRKLVQISQKVLWTIIDVQLQKRAVERSQELRDDWIRKLLQWDGEQLVFIDESAANEKSAHRKYGWAPIGSTPHVDMSTKRSERWSILPAYTSDGLMAWDIVHGSFDKELFNNFIREHVLP